MDNEDQGAVNNSGFKETLLLLPEEVRFCLEITGYDNEHSLSSLTEVNEIEVFLIENAEVIKQAEPLKSVKVYGMFYDFCEKFKIKPGHKKLLDELVTNLIKKKKIVQTCPSSNPDMRLNKPENACKPTYKFGEDTDTDTDTLTTESNKTKPFERPVSPAGSKSLHLPVTDFKCEYIISNRALRNAQVNRCLSQQVAETEQKKEIDLLSSNPDVRLNKSENAWKQTHKFGKDTDTEALKTEDLYKRVGGILNELTPQKFNTLSKKVNDLSIDTEERLMGVIDLVFEKALDEPNFSVAYLCKCLAMKKVPTGNQDNDFVNFRKLLLNKCQKEFERDTADDVARIKRAKKMFLDDEAKKRELDEELEDLERKAKRRSLGNIRFIGELFKLRMLTATIMHICLKKLLNQEDDDSLECLCILLTIIGKDIDPEKSKSNNKEPVGDKMNSYIHMMKEIINKRQTSPRVYFMLQDVIDLRQNNWVPRRDDGNLKTSDQIHVKAEREVLEKEMSLTQPQSHQRIEDKRKSMGGGSSMGEDGWNTVGSKNSSRIDPQKLKLSMADVDEDIQLGPGCHNLAVGVLEAVADQVPESKSSAPANRCTMDGMESSR